MKDQQDKAYLAAFNHMITGIRRSAEPDCSVLEFRMAESDSIAPFHCVAEATNVKGELFGFDRVLELMRSRPR